MIKGSSLSASLEPSQVAAACSMGHFGNCNEGQKHVL